jgi:hypothetical protein
MITLQAEAVNPATGRFSQNAAAATGWTRWRPRLVPGLGY